MLTNLDHREAVTEFGSDVALRLKLSRDGSAVLWPQPTDDPEDPQNVSNASHFRIRLVLMVL